MGIIVITGDPGSAIIFGLMFVGMMFVAGVKLRYFAIAICAAVAAAP